MRSHTAMTMAGSAAQTTTAALRAVVSRHASTLKNALRHAFARTTVPQGDYIRALKKAVLSSIRCRAVELVVALVVDLAHRGSVEEAEGIGLQLAAIARAEHASVHGTPTRLSIAEAQLLEEEAEGVVERAEMAMAQNPGSLSHRLAYLAAAGAHERTRKVLNDAVRRENAA